MNRQKRQGVMANRESLKKDGRVVKMDKRQ